MADVDPRYHTKQWQQLRALIIRRDQARCAMADEHCSDMTRRHAIIVDHILEVRDGGSFWDEVNLQVLCKAHHNLKTAGVRETRRFPVSPNA